MGPPENVVVNYSKSLFQVSFHGWLKSILSDNSRRDLCGGKACKLLMSVDVPNLESRHRLLS